MSRVVEAIYALSWTREALDSVDVEIAIRCFPAPSSSGTLGALSRLLSTEGFRRGDRRSMVVGIVKIIHPLFF